MGFLDKRRVTWHESGQPVVQPRSGDTPPPAVAQTVASAPSFRLEAIPPRWTLDELILAEETREAIQEAAQTILAAPVVEAWLGGGDKVGRRIAVNFYGPPGSGKTSAADALAQLLGMNIMKVNYAELESRFVGETPKNVRLAFRQARDISALLFFDEADSILSRRFSTLSQANEAYINQTRSTMMLELDAFQGVVVFATNLASNYDDAFVRRIASHVRFSLPGRDLRERLWQKYLPTALPQAPDVMPGTLAEMTEGFSPADIATAVRRAAVRAAVRSGPQQQVFLEDLRGVIDKIRSAKAEIGSGSGRREVKVTTSEVSAEEMAKISAGHNGAESSVPGNG